jgi:flagellar biosynthesis anti-sigma factor FlgM
MRIVDPNLTGITPPGATPSQGSRGVEQTGLPRTPAGVAAPGPESPDQVRLSSLAESLQAADPSSPERAQRLSQLAAEVQAGRYSPDPEIIARGLVDEALGPES